MKTTRIHNNWLIKAIKTGSLNANDVPCSNYRERYELSKHFLGEDWYIVDPVTNYEANEIIVREIKEKYTKKYLKIVKIILKLTA